MKKKSLKTPSFFIALFFTKIIIHLIKIIDKERGSHKPGEIAIKICPNFLSKIKMPNKIITVTGTNGKTTVTNLLSNILIANNYTTIINKEGSNTDAGVATALIQNANLLGNCSHDFAIFELDERLSNRVFKHITPHFLICTNLFRDSIKRNGHVEFIFDKINSVIPKNTTLILNADDLISSSLAPKNKRIYFSVENVLKREQKNIVNDIISCPKCNNSLLFTYHHHHHIGQSHCSKCNFKSPTSDFVCTKINKKTKELVIQEKTKETYPLISDSIYNIYNVTAVITTLRTLKLAPEQVKIGLERSQLIENRHNVFKKDDLEIITILSKNQNPISSSLALDYITNLPGTKTIILMVTDTLDQIHGSEDISWLYDTDFEFLKKSNIKQIIACGSRCYDLAVRLRLADISNKIIFTKEDYFEIDQVIKNKTDKIIIAYELYGYHIAIDLKDRILGDKND